MSFSGIPTLTLAAAMVGMGAFPGQGRPADPVAETALASARPAALVADSPATNPKLAASLGLSVYPSKEQSKEQQAKHPIKDHGVRRRGAGGLKRSVGDGRSQHRDRSKPRSFIALVPVLVLPVGLCQSTICPGSASPEVHVGCAVTKACYRAQW